MVLFKPGTAGQVNLALLVLRVIAGLYIATHGYQKVFQYGFAGVTQSFEGMGIPLAAVAAPLVSVLELVGGILVAAGVLTRPIALLLAVDMFVAATFVHLSAGFTAPKGPEMTYLYMASFLALALAGAGAYSVDALLNREKK
ncbi:MAG: DoxX family protein [Gemmatimonadaceae bacterium]